MLYRPLDTTQTDDVTQNLQKSTDEDCQHGIHQHQQLGDQYHDVQSKPQSQGRNRSILLDIPPETLTSITSHLTPPALLSLGCVSSYLAHHIKEDNTWRRAFVCHFLGILPEGDIDLGNTGNPASFWSDTASINSWKTLFLRRVEGKSWRDEFAWRYVTINRWRRSKSTTTTHTPVIHSNISGLHLVHNAAASYSSSQAASTTPVAESITTTPGPSSIPYVYPSTRFGAPALLTSSNQYGIVARSFPLSGRVLSGYLNASTGARLGVAAFGGGNLHALNVNGNPNAQFTPNVTASAVTSSRLASQPQVSSHVPTSGTAHIAWGTGAGELIFTNASRVMDANVSDGNRGGVRNGRSGVEVRRCQFGDEHEGAVRDVKWIDDVEEKMGRWAVSGGSDGRVKLWDAERAVCVWSSEVMVDRERLGSVPDPCVRIDASFVSSTSQTGPEVKSNPGIVVGVGECGDIYVWIGFDPLSNFADGNLDTPNVKAIIIDCPFKPSSFYLNSFAPGHNAESSCRVSALCVDRNSLSGEQGLRYRFLVAYEDDPLFYRVSIGEQHGNRDQVEVTPFGDPNFGPTSIVKPFFGKSAGWGEEQDAGKDVGTREPSFVLVGDHIGCVSLYAWDASTKTHPTQQQHRQYHMQPIPPLRTFEAHRDGATVTALWWDGLILVTGSARGTTHVWDAITFDHLRSFVSPVKKLRGRHIDAETERQRQVVRHVVVNKEKDVLVVAVGDTVMAWHAGAAARSGHGHGQGGGGVRGRHAPGTGVPGKRRAGGAKFIGQYEMRQTILESRDLLESEAKETKKVYGREREHREKLDVLGLNEVEAVEYALMLSRDEANERARAEAEALSLAMLEEQDEGVFEGDFDDEDDNENENSSVYGAPPSVSSSSSSSLVSSASTLSSSSSSGDSRARSTRIGIPIPPSSSSSYGHRSNNHHVRVAPSTSNEKVQVSPPYRGEPKEAGEEYIAADDDDVYVGEGSHHFPPIPGNTGASSTEGSVQPVEEDTKGKGKEKKKSGASSSKRAVTNTKPTSKIPTPTITPGGSPTSLKTSAWSVPLKPKPSSSSAVVVPPSFGAPGALTGAGVSPPFDIAGGSSSSGMRGLNNMDDDLRFALELSLVEARSRGEDV